MNFVVYMADSAIPSLDDFAASGDFEDSMAALEALAADALEEEEEK